MVDSASERPAAPEQPPGDWRDQARRHWRRCLLFVAHWRLRLSIGLTLVVQAVRQAARSVRRGGSDGETGPAIDGGAGPLLPSVASVRSLPVKREADSPSRDEQADLESLPTSRCQQRELPSGNGVLDVQRTPDRLIMFDPATDEAYLASTHWVDIEE